MLASRNTKQIGVDTTYIKVISFQPSSEDYRKLRCKFLESNRKILSDELAILRHEQMAKILRIDPNASQKIATAAYRDLAKRYHPDKNHDESAKATMQSINDAHDYFEEKYFPYKRKLQQRTSGDISHAARKSLSTTLYFEPCGQRVTSGINRDTFDELINYLWCTLCEEISNWKKEGATLFKIILVTALADTEYQKGLVKTVIDHIIRTTANNNTYYKYQFKRVVMTEDLYRFDWKNPGWNDEEAQTLHAWLTKRHEHSRIILDLASKHKKIDDLLQLVEQIGRPPVKCTHSSFRASPLRSPTFLEIKTQRFQHLELKHYLDSFLKTLIDAFHHEWGGNLSLAKPHMGFYKMNHIHAKCTLIFKIVLMVASNSGPLNSKTHVEKITTLKQKLTERCDMKQKMAFNHFVEQKQFKKPTFTTNDFKIINNIKNIQKIITEYGLYLDKQARKDLRLHVPHLEIPTFLTNRESTFEGGCLQSPYTI